MYVLPPEREIVALKIAFNELQGAFADLAAGLARVAPQEAEVLIADLSAAMQKTLADFTASLAPEERDGPLLEAASDALKAAIQLAEHRIAQAGKTQ